MSISGYLCVSHLLSLFISLCVSDARMDIKNNEKKLALEMATNAQCASLIKRKQGGSKSFRP